MYLSILLAGCVWGCDDVPALPAEAAQRSMPFSAQEVRLVLERAASEATAQRATIAVAVTDREGNLLGLYDMAGGGTERRSDAQAKARTAAFLSSNQHAFSTLTASFITRPHFPPGIENTPAGPLYGVGFSSLGGDLVRPAILANGGGLNDKPGGVPLFKDGVLIGGVGVAGAEVGFDTLTCEGVTINEIIAQVAAQPFAVPADLRGDNIYLDGIRARYSNIDPAPKSFDPLVSLDPTGIITAPTAAPAALFPYEGFVTAGGARSFAAQAGSQLSASEVDAMLRRAAAQAGRTRAAIRRPIGSAARVFIAVVDVDGTVLGVWRTADATLFSFDVSAQKARTALAFSRPDNADFGARLRGILGLPAGSALSMTTRAVGFLAQDSYPPGIDRDSLGQRLRAGPLFEGPNFQYQRRLAGVSGLPAYGNGITIFPGGMPLYRNGVLVGAIGVSGDGVDQDDLIAAAGAAGFEPPAGIRCDQFFYDGVRLPYVKFPRRGEL